MDVGAVDRSLRLWGWPLSCLWPFSWLNLQGQQPVTSPPPNSLMAWYWALESGKFWFPAQVYNREVRIHFSSVSSQWYHSALERQHITFRKTKVR